MLDVGCGIGGSSRTLAREYGLAVTGVTLSPQQVRRAQELTAPEANARFQVDDALALSFPDASFDVVCLDYYFWKALGIGATFAYQDGSVTTDRDAYRGLFKHRSGGGQIYAVIGF